MAPLSLWIIDARAMLGIILAGYFVPAAKAAGYGKAWFIMKNRRIGHLGRKVSLMVACLLIVGIAVIVELCVAMFRGLTMNMLEDQCVNGTNMLAYVLDNYSNTGTETNLLDELKEQMGCEFTIFKGDERAYTTIMQNGQRAVGTKLSEELAEIVLEKGETYVGQAEILGVEHLCSYVPTRNSKGEIDGLIFAGISMEEAMEHISKTIAIATAVGFALIVVSLILMASYVSRVVSKPLSRLTDLAHTMEQGDLGIQNERAAVGITSNDEVGFLAQAFENTMNRLNGYISEISFILASIAKGDLTVEPEQEYVGDFISIKDSLNDILAKLNNTMSQIIESANYVSNGSEQMAIGATALSQGAVEQASSIEDLDRNIQNISEEVGNTAKNASQANQKVEQVSGQIQESNRKMGEMIQAMKEINDSSNEIGQIIKTIETISSQTNILALNASVEAARAGEAGKGFAVVAKEVRDLASRSSEASQMTTALIERSIQAVEQGTKIANETAQQLVSVVSGAHEIVDVTDRIAKAANMQAESVFIVREQIRQISSVVQTNSATAEESAATSQQLSQQAGMLKNLIHLFRLRRQQRR